MNTTVNLLKVLSDENRLRILFMLREKNLCACEMLELLSISGATLSSHLKIMKLSGIISQKKDGRWIEYSLVDKITQRFLDFIEANTDSKSSIQDDKRKIKNLNKRELICKK
jgi:ArsR family transcriptional regulator, arsenate/arsenite/antimonite-responsive transcriptional repressor